jgi:hypothetical protein
MDDTVPVPRGESREIALGMKQTNLTCGRRTREAAAGGTATSANYKAWNEKGRRAREALKPTSLFV